MRSAPCFSADGDLGYQRSRTQFGPGEGLRLDAGYRVAHLPLVAPDHPDVIARHAGRGYDMGKHRRLFSLVLPVPGDALARSAAFQTLETELRGAPFADKLAWDIPARRRGKLHATLCGSLGADTPPEIPTDARAALARLGPISVEVRGLFSGNVNVGRLYLKLYPECREGRNLFATVQACLGRLETDLYLAGLHNFTDHLAPAEAQALAAMLERWWDRTLLRFEADSLWLLGACDDLVLDSAVDEVLPLV